MNGLHFLELQNIVLVFHELSQQIEDLHQPLPGRIRHHEVVANLIVVIDPRSVGIIKNEEFVPVSLHKLNQLQPLILRYDDQLVKLLECLLATLQGKINDRDGTGGKLRVAVVGQFDHLVADGGLDDGLDGLLVGYVGQEVADEFVVALHLHGG